jgi:hypothetical protein
MKKDFIPYEQALALKELGFDEPCFGEYRQWDGGKPYLQLYQDLDGCSTDPADYEYTTECIAPTYSQAFRWFREKCGLRHFIEYDNGHYNAVVQSSLVYHCDTHEEAELACLNRLIILITPITNPQTKPWT